MAAEAFEALAEVSQPVAIGAVGGGVETAAVVFDLHAQLLVLNNDLDFDRRGVGVLVDVVERFLAGKVEAVADFRRDDDVRQIVRRGEPAARRGVLEQFIYALAKVADEAGQGVVLRQDGPDDFVEGLDGFAGGGGDFSGLRADFDGIGSVLFGDFGEPGDFGEVRADAVMDVLGDAGAFLFNGKLHFDAAKFASPFLMDDIINRAGHDAASSEY